MPKSRKRVSQLEKTTISVPQEADSSSVTIPIKCYLSGEFYFDNKK